jgi:hypothetical protein
MKKLLLFSVLSLSFLLNSCTKEGPVGPAGPQGPQGPAGSDIYTRTFTVNPSEWIYNSNVISHYVDLSYPEITSTFLSNGGTIVGYRNNGTNIWSSMPNTFYPNIGSNLSWTYEISYITIGIVRVRFIWSNSNSQQAPTTVQTFRINAIGQ